MNVVDEATTAHLKAGVQRCRTVAQMELQAATQVVNTCFERWGLPNHIKIDNSYPFVNPNHRDVPTLAKLYWIGLGIKVIQNTPRCPEENGAVECSQGVMANWSNPEAQPDAESLQQRLDEESEFQRNHYRMPAKKYKTRMELYPALESKARPYDPALFDIQRVYDYLSDQVWQRSVKNNGEVKMFGSWIYIGKRFAKETVTITLDPIEKQWLFRKTDGTLLKTSTVGVPQKKEILDFAVLSKNVDTT